MRYGNAIKEERKIIIISEIDRKKEAMIKSYEDAKKRIIKDFDEYTRSDKARLDNVKQETESVLMNPSLCCL